MNDSHVIALLLALYALSLQLSGLADLIKGRPWTSSLASLAAGVLFGVALSIVVYS